MRANTDLYRRRCSALSRLQLHNRNSATRVQQIHVSFDVFHAHVLRIQLHHPAVAVFSTNHRYGISHRLCVHDHRRYTCSCSQQESTTRVRKWGYVQAERKNEPSSSILFSMKFRTPTLSSLCLQNRNVILKAKNDARVVY